MSTHLKLSQELIITKRIMQENIDKHEKHLFLRRKLYFTNRFFYFRKFLE
jgi:hypothetical protein